MRLFRENRTKNKIVRREKRTEDDEPGQEDKDYRGRTTTNQDKRTKTHTTEDDEDIYNKSGKPQLRNALMIWGRLVEELRLG